LTTALNVLTTKEQAEQSTKLVEVIVVSKTVLVASSGSSKTGCSVVQVVCAFKIVAAKKKERRAVYENILRGR